MKNATHLFGHPNRDFHNSECWWTALFSMLVLYLAKHPDAGEIPIMQYRSTPSWGYERMGVFVCPGLKFSNVLVEAKLRGSLFQVSSWPQHFLDLKSDVTIYERNETKVIFIENKTIGAGFGDQLDSRLALVRYLRGLGWDAELLLLVSIGYERNAEWQPIERSGVRLLLWEDILQLVERINNFRDLFDLPLAPYYKTAQQ